MTLTHLMETHDPQAFKQLRQAGADNLLEIANRVSFHSLQFVLLYWEGGGGDLLYSLCEKVGPLVSVFAFVSF